jgi:hypothetical protein
MVITFCRHLSREAFLKKRNELFLYIEVRKPKQEQSVADQCRNLLGSGGTWSRFYEPITIGNLDTILEAKGLIYKFIFLNCLWCN